MRTSILLFLLAFFGAFLVTTEAYKIPGSDFYNDVDYHGHNIKNANFSTGVSFNADFDLRGYSIWNGTVNLSNNYTMDQDFNGHAITNTSWINVTKPGASNLTVSTGVGSSDTASIRLQRGSWASDFYNDWSILDSSGVLYFNNYYGTWTIPSMYIDPSTAHIATATSYSFYGNHIGTVNGTDVANKFLTTNTHSQIWRVADTYYYKNATGLYSSVDGDQLIYDAMNNTGLIEFSGDQFDIDSVTPVLRYRNTTLVGNGNTTWRVGSGMIGLDIAPSQWNHDQNTTVIKGICFNGNDDSGNNVGLIGVNFSVNAVKYRLSGCVITGFSQYGINDGGIWGNGADSCEISGNGDFTSYVGGGVHVYDASNAARYIDNAVENNVNGFIIEDGPNHVIDQNVIENNYCSGIQVLSNGVNSPSAGRIVGNYFEGNGYRDLSSSGAHGYCDIYLNNSLCGYWTIQNNLFHPGYVSNTIVSKGIATYALGNDMHLANTLAVFNCTDSNNDRKIIGPEEFAKSSTSCIWNPNDVILNKDLYRGDYDYICWNSTGVPKYCWNPVTGLDYYSNATLLLLALRSAPANSNILLTRGVYNYSGSGWTPFNPGLQFYGVSNSLDGSVWRHDAGVNYYMMEITQNDIGFHNMCLRGGAVTDSLIATYGAINNITVDHCRLLDGERGIIIPGSGGDGHHITNNVFGPFSNIGIHIDKSNCTNVVVSDNEIHNSYYGIDVSTLYGDIHDNYIHDIGYRGLTLDSCYASSVYANRVRDCVNDGLIETGSSNYNAIFGNAFKDNGVDIDINGAQTEESCNIEMP